MMYTPAHITLLLLSGFAPCCLLQTRYLNHSPHNEHVTMLCLDSIKHTSGIKSVEIKYYLYYPLFYYFIKDS